ncbi:PadR family transcriptional regulator [Streptomyces sp. NPDC002306]
MSIRHGLLSLLEPGPRYGFQLRNEFESRTGSTWPLNVGQVYTTLSRLERDGLVVPAGEDEGGHSLYAITDTGRAELREWFASPVDRANPPRNELAIKLAMAVGSSDVDVRAVIQAQRVHTITAMQDYTRLKSQALEAATRGEDRTGRDDVAWQLVLEQMIFQAEAEVRWLDHCETRLTRLAASAAPSAPSSSATPPAGTSTTVSDPGTADTAGNDSADTAAAQGGRPRGGLRRSATRR